MLTYQKAMGSPEQNRLGPPVHSLPIAQKRIAVDVSSSGQGEALLRRSGHPLRHTECVWYEEDPTQWHACPRGCQPRCSAHGVHRISASIQMAC